MPHAALGIGDGLGQGRIHGEHLTRARRLPHGRADQRVPKAHRAVLDLDEPGLDRGVEGGNGCRGRPPDLAQRRSTVQRRGQQGRPGLGGKVVQPAGERLLQACRERRRSRRQARRRRGRRAGELDQRQRIARSLGEDAGTQHRVELGRPSIQQLGRRRRAQPLDVERRESRVIERGRTTSSHRGDHRQRLAVQPPGDERQGAQSRAIEPVRVIHHEHDRAALGRLTQELEGRESNSEGIRLDLLAGAKRRVQRPPLRGGQPGGVFKDGVQQLVQTGERELGLRLHSHRGQRPAASSLGSLAGEVQKRRFADTGLATQHQRSAARREAVHHSRDEPGLSLAPDQIAHRVGPDGAGHRPRIGARWTGPRPMLIA
jgi:hypothetical protein